MAAYDAEDRDVPWGKYTYALEGLATRCYLEGAADQDAGPRPGAPPGQKLRFRVELPSRCFVLSVAVKLPNAAECVLPALQDIAIERTLSNGDYETVYDGYIANNLHLDKQVADIGGGAEKKAPAEGNGKLVKEEYQGDSPTSVDGTTPKDNVAIPDEALPRKKVMEVRRAADSLRLTITDMEEKPKLSPLRRRRSTDSEGGSDSGDLRTLGVVVVGYVRGQTPASNRIKILLNSSARLGVNTSMADRAEIDGLLGLAFLGNRRYRQAAELLQRASELVVEVANADAKAGFSIDEALTWAAELNLLSAHAYFEHMPMSNDGIIRLVQVARTVMDESGPNASPRDVRELTTEFLDLRTELLVMLEGLLTVLVKFLSESTSLAVKMASARMIEFVSEQLGCAIARHMAGILNQVLRSYPTCTTFGARERAAASSFSYDSMEDCFERLIDICCRLFPLTEHSVLCDLFDNTLIPVFMDGFQESEYLYFDVDAEEAADELMTTAVAQALRLIYLVLNILGVDARVPTSLITRVLNMLVVESGSPRTPLLLRRTALHTWDAMSKALRQAAFGNSVNAFADHIQVLREYVPKLLADFPRPGFEYGELEEESDTEVEIVKEEYIVPENSQVLQELLKKRRRRTEIVDRHTLGRLLSLICEVCSALEPCDEEEARFLDVTKSLQDTLAHAIADLLMSSLIDVSYHEAAVSGNGPQESNNLYEFGDIKTQLKIVGEVLEELFESYWAALSLLPSAMATDAARSAPVRAVLGWCVDRMSHTAPPRGMLKLLHVTVRGLQHELNTPMYKLPAVPSSPHEVTFISIHRAHLQWFPQSVHEEAFDLMDILNEAVAEDLMAKDLALLIQGLGDQAEKFQARTDASLELLASIVASSVPKRADLAMSSLRALVDPSLGKQRIANGFPKSNRSNTGSFTRRLQFTSSAPKTDPMAKSLYIHVVLASCFDKFDALGRAAKRGGGPSFMGDKIDAFVEHAALSVRCLHACARARTHREYVGAVLGDIFGTCLAMQDHGDGRVRLAGFEIFAASLDVLFLAQKAMVLVPSQPNSSTSEATVLGAGSGPAAPGALGENVNGITELSSHADKDTVHTAATPQPSDGDSAALHSAPSLHKAEGTNEQVENDADSEDVEVKLERRMQEIFAEGGSCSFQSEEIAASQLAFEERGWQMLCAFITSSLGIGKYVDFVVQRACLEYLKGCMLNALRGRSTGASVIAFEHIELLWDAVNRLVGSPWRTLNALALWVICAIVNVAIYSSIMAKGRGAARQRTSQLNEFVIKEVFPRAESLLKSGIRETRVWGMRLLEAYIRARDLNPHVVHAVPHPPGRLLRSLDNLKHDWDDEVRERSQSLLEIHFNSINKKTNSHMQTFTAQAQNFMSMKRHQNDDPIDAADSSRIELWFPPLPKQMQASHMEVYCRTLEAFANAEIEGGEETELVGAAEEKQENDGVYDGGYEDDEEGYEFEEEREGVEAGEDDMEDSAEVQQEELNGSEDLVTVTDGDAELVQSDDFGDSEDEDEGDGEDNVPEQLDMSQKAASIEAPKENNPSGAPSGQTGDHLTSFDSDDDGDEDEGIVEDHEFSSLPDRASLQLNQGPALITQVSDPDEDDFGGDAEAIKVGSSDDDADDEEVVNVTDEEDVLVDVESVRNEKKASPGSPLVAQNNAGAEGSVASTGNKVASNGRRASVSRLSLNLNPDLDEGVQVLRRKGSFTSRPSTSIPIEEGDAPKLARRRSHEVSSVASIIDAANENKLSSREETDSSPGSGGSRLVRRKSAKSPGTSPRTWDAGRVRISDGGSSETPRETTIEKEVSDSSGAATGRLARRRSGKSMGLKLEEPGKDRANDDAEGSAPRDQRGQIRDSVVGGAFLSLSPKGSRIPRGIKLDDEGEDGLVSRQRPSREKNLSPDGGHSKSGSEAKSGSSRPNRRSLPRAPAFVKGAGPQRRLSGGLPNTSKEASDKRNDGGDSGVRSSSGSGSLSNPSPPTGTSRGKLPRMRGNVNRPPRPAGLVLDGGPSERKPDRSHRFSKREPLNLAFGDESEEFDKDLLGDLDPSFDVSDDLGNQMRVGTPTAEALKGRNTLADDGPGSSGFGKRRGSNRNVFNSLHYKGLLDQIGTTPVEDSPRSGGSSASRETEKGSPLSTSKREPGGGLKAASERLGSPLMKSESPKDGSGP